MEEKLTASDFKKYYLILWRNLPSQSKTEPSDQQLKALYLGIGGCPGFNKFNPETFKTLCGYAQAECQWMPAPVWFDNKMAELSAPGREVFQPAGLLSAGVEEVNLDRINELKQKAIESARQAEVELVARCSRLVGMDGKVLSIDSGFNRWIDDNVADLRNRFRTISTRSGSNKKLFNHLIARSLACQKLYLASLEGPKSWEEVCPHAQPIERCA